MNEYEFSILWELVFKGGGSDCRPVDSKIIVNGFPDNSMEDAYDGIKALIELGYVNQGIPSDNEIQKNATICLIRINPKKYDEVRSMVYPITVNSKDSFVGTKLRDELKKKLIKYKSERIEYNK